MPMSLTATYNEASPDIFTVPGLVDVNNFPLIPQPPQVNSSIQLINGLTVNGGYILGVNGNVVTISTASTAPGFNCITINSDTNTTNVNINNSDTVISTYFTGDVGGLVSSTTATGIYYPSNTFIYSNRTCINNISNYISGGIQGSIKPFKPKRGPLIKKSVKSSIKRALKLISNFGMEEDVKIFLGGNEIEVSHPESLFKFVISKKENSLIRYTERCEHHTPYNLGLYTKTNIHVADLCVYMQQTPLLDQILALSMFVKTGNEDSLLEKANYNRLTSDKELRKSLAYNNPMLEKKLRVHEITDVQYR